MISFCGTDSAIKRICPEESNRCKVPVRDPGCKRIGILIDRCVLDDVQALWAAGVVTVCSCCGHGNAGAAFIVVEPEERGKMEALGYREAPPRYEHCRDCGLFYAPKMFGKEADGHV